MKRGVKQLPGVRKVPCFLEALKNLQTTRDLLKPLVIKHFHLVFASNTSTKASAGSEPPALAPCPSDFSAEAMGSGWKVEEKAVSWVDFLIFLEGFLGGFLVSWVSRQFFRRFSGRFNMHGFSWLG